MYFKDLHRFAESVSNLHGITVISRISTQSSSFRFLRKWHSLIHAWRIVKLFPDRSKSFTLANLVRPVGRKSSDKLQWDRIRNSVFEDLVSHSSLMSCLDNHNPSHLETHIKPSCENMAMLLGNWTIPQICSSNFRSRLRFWIEDGNSFIGLPIIRSSVKFSIFPNISGKLSRVEQCERLSCLREVNMMGGKVFRFLQWKASKYLSLSRNPTDSWIFDKFSQSLNDNFSKFGRPDTSGIRVIDSQLLKFKTFRQINRCNGAKKTWHQTKNQKNLKWIY